MQVSFNVLRRKLANAYNELRRNHPEILEDEWMLLHNSIAIALSIYDDNIEGDMDVIDITLYGCEEEPDEV